MTSVTVTTPGGERLDRIARRLSGEEGRGATERLVNRTSTPPSDLAPPAIRFCALRRAHEEDVQLFVDEVIAAAAEVTDYVGDDFVGSDGGERGIRTLDTVSRIHAFQACAFNHSATSPSGRRGAARPGRTGNPPVARGGVV
jgi:hypothetical protein